MASPRWAVVFDLGGGKALTVSLHTPSHRVVAVVLSSPLHFIADYERAHNLPRGLFASVIVAGEREDAPGPFQLLELGLIGRDDFCRAMERLLLASGHEVDMRDWLETLERGIEVRAHFLDAMDRLRAAGHLVAVITNNWLGSFGSVDMAQLRERAHVVVESYVEHVRKPSPAIYDATLKRLRAIDAALDESRLVMLDDIARNLKCPRSRGWSTIHVKGDGREALEQLSRVLQQARL